MKKFMLVAVLSCLGGIIHPDMCVRGMQNQEHMNVQGMQNQEHMNVQGMQNQEGLQAGNLQIIKQSYLAIRNRIDKCSRGIEDCPELLPLQAYMQLSQQCLTEVWSLLEIIENRGLSQISQQDLLCMTSIMGQNLVFAEQCVLPIENTLVMIAQQFFNANLIDSDDTRNTLYCRLDDVCEVVFTEPYRDLWKNLISIHINDQSYTEALDMLLIYAAGNGWTEGVRMILEGNANTTCNNPSLGNTPMLEALASETSSNVIIDEFNTILELRPNTDFSEGDGHNTPMSMAIYTNRIEVVRWFLAENARSGKDFGFNKESQDGMPLEQATEIDCYDILHLLINYRRPDGEYTVAVCPNILEKALCALADRDELINIILDSGRADLNTACNALNLNKPILSLSSEIMTRLHNMATAAQLPNVLSALNVYRFWQAIEENELNMAMALFDSDDFNKNAIPDAIASGQLRLSEDAIEIIRNIAVERRLQLVLKAFHVYDFREALQNKNLHIVQEFLTSGRIGFDDVIKVLNSSEDCLSLETYNFLKQRAQDAQRQDVVQALKELDYRDF